MTKKSLILTGLVLLGSGCTSQVQAFSFGEWVPACIPNIFYENPRKKFERLSKEKSKLQKQLRELDQMMKVALLTKEEIQDIAQKRDKLIKNLIDVNSQFYDTARKLGIAVDEYAVMHCGDVKQSDQK